MSDIHTERLVLHPIDEAEGERIAAMSPSPDDRWADDFPFDGDLVAVGAFLQATAELGEQQPFGYYRIDRLSDGKAIGGVGCKGRPQGGAVEIGYGLVPSVRGAALATEAVAALLSVLAAHGISSALADTTIDNVASQRTLISAGFSVVATEGEQLFYEARLR